MSRHNLSRHCFIKIATGVLLLICILFLNFAPAVQAVDATATISLIYTGCNKFEVRGRVTTTYPILSKGFQFRRKGTSWPALDDAYYVIKIGSKDNPFTAWIPGAPGKEYDVRTFVQYGKSSYAFSSSLPVKMNPIPEIILTGLTSVTDVSCKVNLDIYPNGNRLDCVALEIFNTVTMVQVSELVLLENITADQKAAIPINIQNLTQNVKYAFRPRAYLPEDTFYTFNVYNVTFHSIKPPVTPSPSPTPTKAPMPTPNVTTTPTSSTTAKTTSETMSPPTSSVETTATLETTGAAATTASGTLVSPAPTLPETSVTAVKDGQPAGSGGTSTLLVIVLGVIAAVLLGIAVMLFLNKTKK